MGPETKNDGAGDGQQQFSRMDWTVSRQEKWNMVMSTVGLRTKDLCDDEGQQQFSS
jgi:hypothetical protein